MATSIEWRLLSDQQTYLFTDFRHIDPGDLEWLRPDGEPLPTKPGAESPPAPDDPAALARYRSRRQPRGIHLEAQPAQKIGPLDQDIGINALLHEGGRYRLWYWVGKHAHYAESDDGFTWKLPNFGRYEIAGSTRNNAFFGVPPERGQHNFDGFTVFKDPSAPASERYKLVFMAHVPADEFERRWAEYRALHPRYQDVRLRPGKFTCVYGAVSPDGLDWTLLPEPLFTHFTDTITTAYYDAWLGRYVLYTRMYLQGRRWVGRTETADFRRWPPVEPLLWPRIDESPSNDIYTNARTSYPGEPSIHLMFPMFYERWNQISRIRMYASADGIVWNEVPGGAVINPGTPGEWDSEFLGAGTGLAPLGDERVGLLYSGTSYPHKYPRWPHVIAAARTGWACWPRDRLGAVVADEEGEFWTLPVQPPGARAAGELPSERRRWRVGRYPRPAGAGGDGLRPALRGLARTDGALARRVGPRHRRRCPGRAALQAPRGQALQLHVGLGGRRRCRREAGGRDRPSPCSAGGRRGASSWPE